MNEPGATRRDPVALITPFAPDQLEPLRSGDLVLISGRVITARDAAHERFARALRTGEDLPVTIAGQTLYYVGPTPARPGHVIGSAGPTTASRMDPYTPQLIELGVRGLIGKGRRSATVRHAMTTFGCIYFGAVEGTAALLSQRIRSCEVIAYPDLGAEAVHRLELDNFPAVVVNDLVGGDLYESGPARWRTRA